MRYLVDLIASALSVIQQVKRCRVLIACCLWEFVAVLTSRTCVRPAAPLGLKEGTVGLGLAALHPRISISLGLEHKF
jgi:hypothetical protein